MTSSEDRESFNAGPAPVYSKLGVRLMPPKKKNDRAKTKKKTGKKTKSAKRAKPQVAPKKTETKKPETPLSIQQVGRVEAPVQELVRITIENIRGETAIGDLLVSFPRTREVLVRNGLRLEAEDAGDIYMTVEAFAALNGLKAESLVQDLVVIAREPLPQQPTPTLASAPAV